MSNNEKAAQEEVSQVTAGQQETAAEKASPVKPQQQQPKAVEPDTGAEEGDTGDDEQPAVEKSNGHAGKNGKAGVGEEAGAEVNGTDAKNRKRSANDNEAEDANGQQKKKRVEDGQAEPEQVQAGAD